MDCNKTIDFFAEAKRLCNSHDKCVDNAANKEQCPMFEVCSIARPKICAKDIKKAIEIVQKWSNEHSQKTYMQDFFEKFPKAQLDSDGTPFVCRKRIYGGECQKDEECDDYTGTCENCWNEPMEE